MPFSAEDEGMGRRRIRFSIFRYKPGRVDPPRFESFDVSLGPRATVLDALEELRIRHDPTLLYRHSCHHASCGTCAMKINGVERLACVTVVRDLDAEEIVLEPMAGFPLVADLVVDMQPLCDKIPPGLNGLRESEYNPEASPVEGVTRYERFESCIECGACMSACPVSQAREAFIGPAGLAAISRELEKDPSRVAELIGLAEGDSGVWRCVRALHCSKVCPKEVYPAWHIHKLRRRLEGNGDA
jgi:succinate dehydrogenase / fumarate reductase iron-sulfur subunit